MVDVTMNKCYFISRFTLLFRSHLAQRQKNYNGSYFQNLYFLTDFDLDMEFISFVENLVTYNILIHFF